MSTTQKEENVTTDDHPLVRPELGAGYPGVPFRQDWPNLRFPLDTACEWDDMMEDHVSTGGDYRFTEDQAIDWCRANGYSFVWAGGRDAGAPCAFLGFVLTHGHPEGPEPSGEPWDD